MNHMPFPRRTGVGVGVRWLYLLGAALVGLMFSPLLFAHGVEAGDATFIEQASGAQLLPFIYLGAKHMVTGYDHLLFLAGVIFFLYRMKDVGIYVTLFAVGHSVTLLYAQYQGRCPDFRVFPWVRPGHKAPGFHACRGWPGGEHSGV